MDNLLMAAPEEKPKKKRAKKRKSSVTRPSAPQEPKNHGIHINVNVSTAHGDGQKKAPNQADDMLSRLRGF